MGDPPPTIGKQHANWISDGSTVAAKDAHRNGDDADAHQVAKGKTEIWDEERCFCARKQFIHVALCIPLVRLLDLGVESVTPWFGGFKPACIWDISTIHPSAFIPHPSPAVRPPARRGRTARPRPPPDPASAASARSPALGRRSGTLRVEPPAPPQRWRSASVSWLLILSKRYSRS